MSKILIVGFGSIGKKHANLLKSLGQNVYIYSKRNIRIDNRVNSIQEAISQNQFKYIIIANETSLHYQTLLLIKNSGFKGLILVEKPIFEKEKKSFSFNKKNIYVAYNFRFHPSLLKLKKLLNRQKIISANIYAGQYLPGWRQGRHYYKSYSAKSSLGGGVLLDLSHEIDYILWLFGDCINLTANGGKFSRLKIDSEDIYHVLLKTVNCPLVQLELNYLDKIKRRYITVNTEKNTYHIDFINSTIQINKKIINLDIDDNLTYLNMHQSILSMKLKDICTFSESLKTIKIIDALKISNKKKKWINFK